MFAENFQLDFFTFCYEDWTWESPRTYRQGLARKCTDLYARLSHPDAQHVPSTCSALGMFSASRLGCGWSIFVLGIFGWGRFTEYLWDDVLVLRK
jgi:hypothetical protein